ncbi:hypothetical protein WT27_19790 [Burkholderia territorii]|uniref:Uncharacterized protein n=1 Tax=Burkholderia territorii TaxID=1503055 RepID=A0A105UWE7_9BURK|nr:hypothetical protein WT27_19790 [Burkholderia territorii]
MNRRGRIAAARSKFRETPAWQGTPAIPPSRFGAAARVRARSADHKKSPVPIERRFLDTPFKM